MPEEALGTDYYTLTWDPTNGPSPQQTISVASFNTETNLELNLAAGVSIVYNGVTYNQGTPLRVTIGRWATFHLIGSSGADFSGKQTQQTTLPTYLFLRIDIVSFTNTYMMLEPDIFNTVVFMY